MNRLLAWLLRCWRCGGRGYVTAPGRRLTPAELTPAQYADQLVNGGWHAIAVREPCPRCSS